MEVWHYKLEAAPASTPHVVTLGNFDGVHRGHRELLEHATTRARDQKLPAAVVTFDPHPTVVVAPERKPLLLMTLAQRLAEFESAGMDLAWVIPFSRSFSELSPGAFLHELKRALSPVELHVGKAFRFGQDRAGDFHVLEAWGKQTGCRVFAHALKAPDGGRLSSTRIRQALNAGEVGQAAGLLGHPYALTGIVVEGERRGRHLGFPTANLHWEQEQLPANGVYVTEVRGRSFASPRLGLTNIGQKPTFAGQALSVETFLPGFEGDLYGASMELRFLHRLRGERRFQDIAALRAQIASDVAQGQAWWDNQRSG
ncbi:MAG: bifunctional riboflavin kinase/FAD synthetase [Acidobacteriota bacterium]|nr:bifunctional riboflavin kinase/FAD synthetase [Acidobacteriota bacterium]